MIKKILVSAALLLGLANVAMAQGGSPYTIQTVPTIAALRALGSASKFTPTIQVLGYNAANDNGGGLFSWNATSTATAESCVTFAATGVSTGRWIRQLNGSPLNVLQCGAYSDGSNAATTLASFQAANDYIAANANPAGRIHVPGGTYNLGSTTTGVFKTASFSCPLWEGDGEATDGHGTIIQFTPPSEAAAFTFVGTPGSICSGGVQNMVFEGNTHTIAVELQGQGGATINISAIAPMERAVLLHNKLTGQFTEFNNLTINTNGSTFPTVLEYRVDSGNPSFHGSGLVGGVINWDGTDPAVLVGAGAFPYNAPLTATFFPASGASIVVQNSSATAFGEPWFTGNVSVETGAATSITMGTGSDFFLNGGVTVLGADAWHMGTMWTGRKFGSLVNGQRVVNFDPLNFSGALTGATTTISWPTSTSWNHYLVTVEVLGDNYTAYYSAQVQWVEGGSGYNIVNVINTNVNNTAGYGNIVMAFPSTGANFTIAAAGTAYATGHNLRYRITMVQLGQGSDHFILQ